MRITKLILVGLAVCAAVVLPALAQEGHPLKGTWIGDWGPNATMRTPVFLVLDWDGKDVTGTLNPGTDGLAFKAVAITLPAPPAGRGGATSPWTVRMETTTRNGQPIVIEGRVENLGLANRSFIGEWTQGNVKGTFKVGRQ
jgi:hypothetical protein